MPTPTFLFPADHLKYLLNDLTNLAHAQLSSKERKASFNRLSRVARDLLQVQGKIQSLSIVLDAATVTIAVKTDIPMMRDERPLTMGVMDAITPQGVINHKTQENSLCDCTAMHCKAADGVKLPHVLCRRTRDGLAASRENSNGNQG